MIYSPELKKKLNLDSDDKATFVMKADLEARAEEPPVEPPAPASSIRRLLSGTDYTAERGVDVSVGRPTALSFNYWSPSCRVSDVSIGRPHYVTFTEGEPTEKSFVFATSILTVNTYGDSYIVPQGKDAFQAALQAAGYNGRFEITIDECDRADEAHAMVKWSVALEGETFLKGEGELFYDDSQAGFRALRFEVVADGAGDIYLDAPIFPAVFLAVEKKHFVDIKFPSPEAVPSIILSVACLIASEDNPDGILYMSSCIDCVTDGMQNAASEYSVSAQWIEAGFLKIMLKEGRVEAESIPFMIVM